MYLASPHYSNSFVIPLVWPHLGILLKKTVRVCILRHTWQKMAYPFPQRTQPSCWWVLTNQQAHDKTSEKARHNLPYTWLKKKISAGKKIFDVIKSRNNSYSQVLKKRVLTRVKCASVVTRTVTMAYHHPISSYVMPIHIYHTLVHSLNHQWVFLVSFWEFLAWICR